MARDARPRPWTVSAAAALLALAGAGALVLRPATGDGAAAVLAQCALGLAAAAALLSGRRWGWWAALTVAVTGAVAYGLAWVALASLDGAGRRWFAPSLLPGIGIFLALCAAIALLLTRSARGAMSASRSG